MPHRTREKFRLLVLLVLLPGAISCGRSTTRSEELPQMEVDNPSPPPVRGHRFDSPPITSFAITTSEGFPLSGTQCGEGVTLNVHWRWRDSVYVCHPGQWILTYDHLNNCHETGCTEMRVQPFVANLRQDYNRNGFYYIRPVSPVTKETWDMVNEYGLSLRSGTLRLSRID